MDIFDLKAKMLFAINIMVIIAMLRRICYCWPAKSDRNKRYKSNNNNNNNSNKRQKQRKTSSSQVAATTAAAVTTTTRTSTAKHRQDKTNKSDWKKEESSIRLTSRSGFAQVPTTPTTSAVVRSPESKETNKLSRPSTPSQMKTTDITNIIQYDPNETTVEEILRSNGYKLEAEIGKGSFGSVYRARDLVYGTLVACKVIDMSKSSKNQSLAVRNELFIMESVNHPHIIKLYQHFIIESANSRMVYIFMQLAKSKSLSVYVRSFKTGLPEQIAKRMFAQIVSAINHLHEKHIAHRDIKMGNVLLDDNNDCLVTDFGLSRFAYRPSTGQKIFTNKFCGTMPYMAPEILLTRDNKLMYDPFAADIWALGVLLYCMINRGYPFTNDSNKMLEQQMLHKIRFGKKIQFEPPVELFDLFQRILEPNAELRLRMDQLMKHPWLIKEMNIVEKNVRRIIAEEKNLSLSSISLKTKNQAMWARESFLDLISKRKMALIKKNH